MNLADIGNYMNIFTTISNIFKKLDPKVSIRKEGPIIKVSVAIDRTSVEISEDINLILENMKPLKISNIIVELRLRDKVLRLTDNG